ncbi:MAG TPA: trimethylamine methyltransferase family protein [Steroidobacteraceae bacterium]|nr:trimethylamine methyltransferase family protein [Steroidobacteraceae bacterium]
MHPLQRNAMIAEHTKPRRRRPAATAATAAAPDRGLHLGATPAYEPLAAGTVDLLIDSACALLRDSGCMFEPDTEAVAILRAAGCDVSAEGIARFEPALVREALASVPTSARLWHRDGDEFIELDAAHTWFMPGMTCIKSYDAADGPPRDSTADDLAAATRLADALPNIDAVCIACKDVPHSTADGEINEFAIMARHTAKPLEYLCESAESLATVIDMAAALRGSRAALAQRPYFLQIVTPLPLGYWRTHSDQILLAARAGVPVSVGTLPIGGASTPITVSGSIVNSLATDFAGMTLGQLARRGAFVIGSSDVSFMEPATGGIGHFTHASLADMAMHQIRRRLGLPSFTGFAGQSSAPRFNQDAVWEISAGMMQVFFSRPATLDYLGSLDEGLTFSLHALCLCDELAGLLRSMWRGIPVDAESVALDLMRSVGPRGNYLALDHTAAHCRDQVWPARYLGAVMPTTSNSRPQRDLIERIDADLKRIQETHEPRPMPPAILAQFGEIQARAASARAP